MISDDDFRQALDRVARTPDGELLYLHFQKILMGIVDTPEPGTLQRHEGRRRLASELMGLMAKGIEDSGGRTDDSSGTGKRTERPVVFAIRQPAAVSRRESFREHSIRTDPELPRDSE